MFVIFAASRENAKAPLVAIALFMLGFGWIMLSPLSQGTYTLQKKLKFAQVSGKIVSIEPLENQKAARVTIKPSSIDELSGDTPKLIRIKVHDASKLLPEQEITALTSLMPPAPPVAPNAFDFQRHAYFKGLGAVGFAYKITSIKENNSWTNSLIPKLRDKVNKSISNHLPAKTAGAAMALITGTKTAMSKDDILAMRNSGLAHMLAISGLHIGMVAGIVFFISRLFMSAIPSISLNHPIKKYAAAMALIAAIFYMMLAGATTPTQRATIMTGIALVAIIFDRWPFSIRVVAAAALIILAISPSSLISAGFQMSFAAVASLIYAFGLCMPYIKRVYEKKGMFRRIGIYFAGVLLTDLVASIATTAFSAYHFQQVATYTLLGNFLSAPIFAFIVMPAGVLAMFLMPLGLEGFGLWIMGQGIEIILNIARFVSSIDGALYVPIALPPSVLLCICAFLYGLILLRRWFKVLIVIPLIAGIIITSTTRPPKISIAPNGELLGLNIDGGFYVSSLKRDKFTREIWERRAGLSPNSSQNWSDAPMLCDIDACRITINDKKVSFLLKPYAKDTECNWADILISAKIPIKRWSCKKPSVLIDKFDIWKNGAYSIWIDDEVTVKNVRQTRGKRPWAPNK